MSISDDKLMAYVDGELDGAEHDALESAIAADPELARRVAAQQGLRQRLRQAFNRTLDEPVPQRLIEAAGGASIVDFRAAASHPRRPRIAATAWFAAAASLVLGVFVGPWLLRMGADEPQIVAKGGSVIASGELADALSEQLASEQASAGRIRMGVSFIAHDGEYCRSFVAAGEEGSSAGLACRERDVWRVRVLEALAKRPREDGTYRQAATSLPPLVLEAAEGLMAGDPLDANGEAAARARNWQRSPGSDGPTSRPQPDRAER